MTTIAEFLDKESRKILPNSDLVPVVITRAEMIFKVIAREVARDAICEAIDEFVRNGKRWRQRRERSRKFRLKMLQWSAHFARTDGDNKDSSSK